MEHLWERVAQLKLRLIDVESQNKKLKIALVLMSQFQSCEIKTLKQKEARTRFLQLLHEMEATVDHQSGRRIEW